MAGMKVPMLVDVIDFLAVIAKLDEKIEVLHDLSQLRNRRDLDATLNLLHHIAIAKTAKGNVFDEYPNSVDEVLATSRVLFGDAGLDEAAVISVALFDLSLRFHNLKRVEKF